MTELGVARRDALDRLPPQCADQTCSARRKLGLALRRMQHAEGAAAVRPYPQHHAVAVGERSPVPAVPPEAFGVALRFTLWMMSPGCRPALSAGLPGTTFSTTAPCTWLGAWICWRVLGSRSPMPMPQRGLPFSALALSVAALAAHLLDRDRHSHAPCRRA